MVATLDLLQVLFLLSVNKWCYVQSFKASIKVIDLEEVQSCIHRLYDPCDIYDDQSLIAALITEHMEHLYCLQVHAEARRPGWQIGVQ